MIRQLENHLAIPSRHPSTTHRSFSILQKPELFTSTRSTHACASISWDDIAGNDFYVLFLTSIVCSHFFVPKTNVEKEHTFSWGILRVFKVGPSFFPPPPAAAHAEGLSYNHSEDANASYKAWYKEKRIKGCLPQRQIMGNPRLHDGRGLCCSKGWHRPSGRGFTADTWKHKPSLTRTWCVVPSMQAAWAWPQFFVHRRGAPAGVFMNRQAEHDL